MINNRFGTNRFLENSHKKKLMGEINITPFVDIMLVLLIIFMVTAPMLTNGFDVNLPKVSANRVDIKKVKQIIFVVDKNDIIRIDQKVVNIDSLNQYLTQYDPKNTQIFIKGDTDANYGKIIKLMAIINSNHFTNISLVTSDLKPDK